MTSNERGRRPIGRRQLVMRWLQLAVVVGVIGYSGTVALSSVLGDDDDRVRTASTSADAVTADLDDSTDDSADDSAVGATGPDVAGTDPVMPDDNEPGTETSVPPDTSAERTGPPSASEPAQVYIVGDSDAGTFGPYLQTLLDGTLIVDTDLNYKVSSGLARPDFFDWPAELTRTLPEVDPDIVVVTFGGNDSQGLSLPQEELEFIVGDPLDNEAEWTEEYRRRVGAVMDLLLDNDRRVIWVGTPNDDNPDVTARLRLQDEAVRAEVDERPDVVFIDTWLRFSGRDGGWAEFVVDPRDGIGKDVRAADGYHLNENGAEILALDIAQAVRDQLRDMGATI